MKERLSELIKDYEEKRKMIEADRKQVLNELLLQTRIRISDEFSDKELMSFEVYDQFFNQIHDDLLVEQKKFNEFSNQVLTIKRKEFLDELDKILQIEDQKTSDSYSIVEEVMNKSINDLEKIVFNETTESLEATGNAVTTVELEDLLMEIRKNFNE